MTRRVAGWARLLVVNTPHMIYVSLWIILTYYSEVKCAVCSVQCTEFTLKFIVQSKVCSDVYCVVCIVQ